MKVFITILCLSVFSVFTNASEVTSLKEIKELKDRTIELKQDVKIGYFFDLAQININRDSGCQTDRVLDLSDLGFLLKKGTLLTVKTVKAKSRFNSILDLEGPRQSSAGVQMKLSGITFEGKDLEFGLRCWSGSGSKLSKKKVESDVIQMINTIMKI